MGTSILAVTGLLGSVVPSAHALSTQAINFTSIGSDLSAADFVVGYQFTVNGQDINVDHLGYYDSGQDGLLISHDVGIFREDGNLVISATVPSGTAANLTGFFRYVPIASTILTANTTYRIAGSSPDGFDPYSFVNGGFTVDPAIAYNKPAFAFGSTLTFPDLISLVSNGFFGANFTFTNATPVPFEFSPALGLGVLGAAFVIKQKLKKKSAIK